MNTKNIIRFTALATLLPLTACNDWLTEDTPGSSTRDEYFISSSDVAHQVVIAAYVPMMWEYSASTTYFPEWFVGDVVSDDALKGGQMLTDMPAAYDMENFKTNTNNQLLLGFYRAQWEGIARANLAIAELPVVPLGEGLTDELRRRYEGEAYFLRANYYFRLMRLFGGMPLIDHYVESSSEWHNQVRATRDMTLAFITADLERADSLLWPRSRYADTDLGSATQGASEAMLLKANLYRAGYAEQEGRTAEAQTYYAEARKWGKKLIESGEYSLCSTYFDNFTLAGENGPESVFEIQYIESETSDYGSVYEGPGMTVGTFTVILQRSRSSAFCAGRETGWGFNKPTQNLYDEFEPGDSRREAAIIDPTDEQIETPSQEIYCGNRFCARKYSMYSDGDNGAYYHLTHATRGPINNKVIRYADVLLMYAEACVETGDLAAAKDALNQVRQRAGLQPFPYTATIQRHEQSYADTQSGLRSAVRHERRVELAMEGHRWFDLCRWGIAKQTMDAYIQGETAEAQAEYGTFVEGVHELFPIPSEEIDLSGLAQNPGYQSN